MSEPWAINAGKASTAIGTATIESDDNLFTIAGHGLGDGDTVTVDTLTGGGSALTADAVYFVRDVDGNDFALSLSLHGPQVEFATDGGADVYHFAPQYNAAQLRRLNAGLMFGGTSDAFGVRQGVRPGHVPLSVSGTTWTVEDLTGAVYPGLSSDDGGYPVAHQSESGSLDPADGSNDRIDALDLQIQDDDEDASGFRRARVVYVDGTPAADPDPPTVTTNALRLGTILVPSGGSPSPSIATLAQWAVASGGVLPVADDSDLPSDGTYDGMTAWDQDDGAGALKVDDGSGSSWDVVARRDPPVARLRRTTGQSLSGGTDTTAIWDAEDFDTAGGHSTSVDPEEYVVQVPGYYRLTAHAHFQQEMTDDRFVWFWKNGTSIVGSRVSWKAVDGDSTGTMTTVIEPCAVGDVLVVRVKQTSGGPLNLFGGTGLTGSSFEIEWRRPL